MFGVITKILRRVRGSNGRVNPAPDNLVGLAANHFAQDFPNPGSHECPVPGTFAALVSSGLLPSDDLREHMLMCSECFTNYRQELTRNRATQTVPRAHPQRTRLVPIF